jgi:uncharacterized oligopeptide transporter (OPT) family protein
MLGGFFSKVFTAISKLPAFVLVFLFPLGLIVFIGSIIMLFWALANVEGIASVIMVLAGFGMAKGLNSDLIEPTHRPDGSKEPKSFANLFTAGIIAFYALMGMAIDQPGNYFFNKPLEWFFCPTGSTLNREVTVLHPLPGRTDMIQDYTCRSLEEGKEVAQIGMGLIIGVRFVEYVIIGFGFKWLLQLTKRTKVLPKSR